MKALSFLILTFSMTTFAAKFSYVDRAHVYRVVKASQSLLNAIVAYQATYGFSPVKSITASTITVEREHRGSEESYKEHTCEWTMTAELENGGKVSAVEERYGACR